MLKLKLQDCGHLMWRADSLEKSLLLRKLEGRGKVAAEDEMVRWHHQLSCSIAHLCPALCNPVDCSLPGFPVRHYFLELAQTHVHWVGDASFSISPSNEYSELISFRIDWFDLLAVQGTLKSLLQHHRLSRVSSNTISSSVLSLIYGLALTFIHDYWRNHYFKYMELCRQSMFLLFNMLYRFIIWANSGR